MINIKNLSKSYPKTTVFDNFNLQINKGEITCILGESGSGKTTLLNVLAGLTKHLGQVDKVDCAYAFQKPNLFANMTVYQNLKLINDDDEKILNLLETFRLKEKKESYPNHLSGGQVQRVALARAILYNQPLLLLDEPFSNLDIALKRKTVGIIKEHHKNTNNTIVLVTHDILEAVSLADRIIVLSKGMVVFDEKNQQKKTEEKLFNLLENMNNE